MTSTNKLLVPQAKHGLDSFKYEIANSMGMTDYDSVDKGNLPSRVNGSIGGEMVKRMVAEYENKLK